jgi:hypothetical protein
MKEVGAITLALRRALITLMLFGCRSTILALSGGSAAAISIAAPTR